MAHRDPSLNHLRAFESAVRLGSFAAAATELHVTPAAVSQKVRLLEDGLGFKLFRRHANNLELTEQGRAYQPGLQDAFAAIARLTEQVRAMRAGPVLTIGVAPALALHWLIPRLSGFNQLHPDTEVRIATGGLMNPLRDDWTCTIRRGEGNWPGYEAEELFPSTLVAVCAPEVAKQLRRVQDLRKVAAIVVTHLRDQWTWWSRAIGSKVPVRCGNEVTFGSSSMGVQAALDGVGVVVAQIHYVSDTLATKRLIAPFGIPRQRYESWYLAYRPVRSQEPVLAWFTTGCVMRLRVRWSYARALAGGQLPRGEVDGRGRRFLPNIGDIGSLHGLKPVSTHRKKVGDADTHYPVWRDSGSVQN